MRIRVHMYDVLNQTVIEVFRGDTSPLDPAAMELVARTRGQLLCPHVGCALVNLGQAIWELGCDLQSSDAAAIQHHESGIGSGIPLEEF